MREFETHLEEQRRQRLANSSKKNQKKNYTLPFHQQVWACTQRQFLVVYGDKASLIGKWGSIVFQGLIVGSLFYNLPKTSAGAFTRGGVLFFVLLFNALLALAEMTAAFTSKPILLKHKSFSFYRPAAYALAQTVVDVPLVFVQVTIFDLIIYFMAGLGRTPSQFFISILFLWIVTMTMYAFFRGIAAVCNSLDSATRVTGVAIQALIVYTGYLIPPTKMVSVGGLLGCKPANVSPASLVQVAHVGQPGAIRIRGFDVKRVLQFETAMRSAKSGTVSGRYTRSSILYFIRQSPRSNNSRRCQLYPHCVYLQALPLMAELRHHLCIPHLLPRIDYVWDGVRKTKQG